MANRLEGAWLGHVNHLLVGTNHISRTADRLRGSQLSSPVSVINLWWSPDNCWSHAPSKSLYYMFS